MTSLLENDHWFSVSHVEQPSVPYYEKGPHVNNRACLSWRSTFVLQVETEVFGGHSDSGWQQCLLVVCLCPGSTELEWGILFLMLGRPVWCVTFLIFLLYGLLVLLLRCWMSVREMGLGQVYVLCVCFRSYVDSWWIIPHQSTWASSIDGWDGGGVFCMC